MNWKKLLIESTIGIEKFVDDLTFKIRKKLKWNSPVIIMPYRSYGRKDYLYIIGRVLENKLIKPAESKESLITNLANMYKRFQSDEVPGVTIQIDYHGEKHQVISDDEGYFKLVFKPKHIPTETKLYHLVSLKIIEAPIPFTKDNFIAEVMVPPVDAEFGVISDIDDTVIKTSATKILAMAKTVFLNNAHSRLPFAGVAAFYQALMLGKKGKQNNPFFYVSSSPWNTYDLLKEFLDLNKIPEGPLLLRDFGLQDNKFFSSGHMEHKTKEIVNILETYPNLNFILIGDSGQQDIYIYTEIALKFPERILAIYIRDLELKKTEEKVLNQTAKAAELGIEIILSKDAQLASIHAAKKGFIFSEAIEAVNEDKKQDTGELPGKVEDEMI
ncbi:App1 family protein [Pedobacter alpinus]|uniref:App1 family protein n=1 Tax=Pedobacter alpinus TaxID=1590643 RepID=A0ABW5TTE0_9SPHI